MSKFDVWVEGYNATGNRGVAKILGSAIEAENFQEACMLTVDERQLTPLLSKDCTTLWGCRFFDNEADARRSFG